VRGDPRFSQPMRPVSAGAEPTAIRADAHVLEPGPPQPPRDLRLRVAVLERCGQAIEPIINVNPRRIAGILLHRHPLGQVPEARNLTRNQVGVDIHLNFLPPYCPDHNRIERIRKDLHDNVTHNYRCASMEELMAQVRCFLAARNRCRRRTYARNEDGMA
jgi:hypothetical protein